MVQNAALSGVSSFPSEMRINVGSVFADALPLDVSYASRTGGLQTAAWGRLVLHRAGIAHISD